MFSNDQKFSCIQKRMKCSNHAQENQYVDNLWWLKAIGDRVESVWVPGISWGIFGARYHGPRYQMRSVIQQFRSDTELPQMEKKKFTLLHYEWIDKHNGMKDECLDRRTDMLYSGTDGRTPSKSCFCFFSFFWKRSRIFTHFHWWGCLNIFATLLRVWCSWGQFRSGGAVAPSAAMRRAWHLGRGRGAACITRLYPASGATAQPWCRRLGSTARCNSL